MHLGRVWLAYWLFPVPNERQLWPNHSPLMWDLLAITTYVLGSTMYLPASHPGPGNGARPFHRLAQDLV